MVEPRRRGRRAALLRPRRCGSIGAFRACPGTEVLTHAEKSLTRTGQVDAVKHIRHLFQKTIADEFREAVERLTGRTVLAFISGNRIDPDVAAELFVLDGPLGEPDGRLIVSPRRSAAV